MKRTILLSLGLAVTIGTNLFAQEQADTRGRTYAFVAPGGVVGERMVHIGVGGETPLYKGLNLGAELGYVGVGRNLEGSAGILAVNGSYHFRNATRSRMVVPFVTAGTSLAFPYGGALGGNFGGGVNYWLHDRMGLRLEFRDHMFYDDVHLYEFRVGFTFRGRR